jgi:hypothetical protein
MSDEDVKTKKLGVNAFPKDGFSLVVDGKFKTHYTTADAAQKKALELKNRYPLLQIMVRDDTTGIRTVVEADATVTP